MKPTIGITGSSGFVGSNLCLSLACRGYQVRKILRGGDRQTALLPANSVKSFLTEDTMVERSEALQGVDCVIHCAGLTSVPTGYSNSLKEYRAGNVEYSRMIAQESVRNGVRRFIYLSTVKVNGESTSNQSFFTNESVINPQTAYARSKWEGEEVIKNIAEKEGMEYVIIRPPLIYGPGLKGNLIKILGLVYRGVPLPLKSVKNSRSMVSLNNLIDLVIQSIFSQRVNKQTLLVSDGDDLSTPDLLKTISQHMKKRQFLFSVEPKYLHFFGKLIGKESEIEKLTTSLRLDISHTNEMAKWTPPFSANAELKKTVDWYMTSK